MAVESPLIIVRKVRKGGHGHHGGAWKVAFADFVTAMMAFFMLMWLMGSTTPEQKAAISDFFNNPVPGEGSGGTNPNPVLDGGAGLLDGQGPSPFPSYRPIDSDTPREDAGAASEILAEKIAAERERERMESLLEELNNAIEAGQSLKPFKDQLLIDITNEGLRIQIVDKENRAMFAQGSPVLENYMREILREIVKVINTVPNRISISGHTDRTPYASSNGYSNWELSADRANAARRELVAGGLPETKIGRVVGLSSSVLFDKENPYSPINRRISIIVMNKAAEEAVSEGEGRQAEGASSNVRAGQPTGVTQPAAPPSPASTPGAPAPATPLPPVADPAPVTAGPATTPVAPVIGSDPG